MSTGEIIIVGMGPSGVALAAALAKQGIEVSLIDGGPPTPTIEGYSRRTLSLMGEFGLQHCLASLTGPLARNGTWGDRSAHGYEWIGNRASLHGALRQDALDAGVTILRQRWADELTRQARKDGAKIVIHAYGRRGRANRGPLLLAISAKAPSMSGQPKTSIGVWKRGWYWIADDGTNAQIQLVGHPRDGNPVHWFRLVSETCPEVKPLIGGLGSHVLARAATARFALAEDPLTLVGDAALAIDPLSGHGVYESLLSARMHVAAVKTVLLHGRLELVRRYLSERRAETWTRTTGVAAKFYEEQEGRGPFWAKSALAYRHLAQASLPMPVREARIEQKAVLENGYICEASVVVTPELPRGAWKLAGVPLVELHQLLAREQKIERVIAMGSQQFGCSVDAVESATSWLRASGLGASQSGLAS